MSLKRYKTHGEFKNKYLIYSDPMDPEELNNTIITRGLPRHNGRDMVKVEPPTNET